MIKLPKDLIQVHRQRGSRPNTYFKISKSKKRVTVPKHIIEMFPKLGVDMYVSPEEKCLYLLFVPRDKSQFVINVHNGLIGCTDLFKWLNNVNLPVFEDYQYSEYEIDTKNKIVKLNLVRK